MRNWADSTIWTGDNLPIMRGMNTASVDLIYLDPPFNSKRDYAAPIGSKAAGAEFKDTWSLSDIDVEWINLIEAKHSALYRVLLAAMSPSDKSYLVYMAARILEMRRVLNPSGSIYLHCDPTMSHYLKLVMDAIFGKARFQSEIVWQRTSTHNSAQRWGPIHDTILFYSRTENHTWNRILQPYDHDYTRKYFRLKDAHGRAYQAIDLTGSGVRTGDSGRPWRGVDPTAKGRHWALPSFRSLPEWITLPDRYLELSTQARLDLLEEAGMIYWPARGTTPRLRRYLSVAKGKPIQDMVTDIRPLSHAAKERVGYPTQKPLALLERIIKSSSNPGDMVLDPFCGCATTCVSADALQRQWTGIDVSPKAGYLVVDRIKERQGFWRQIVHRTDLGKLPAPRAHKRRLYGDQEGNCGGCREHFEARHLEVDHIIARAKGGTDHIDNLQLLCGSCNRIKGDRGMEYLTTRLQL
ncbi:MAG: DNA methyltransferase [Caldilineaceae bacterium]|nr:DNA methyltransferase [Caldilineaceae bacterium]